jgi:hypothetical protein
MSIVKEMERNRPTMRIKAALSLLGDPGQRIKGKGGKGWLSLGRNPEIVLLGNETQDCTKHGMLNSTAQRGGDSGTATDGCSL